MENTKEKFCPPEIEIIQLDVNDVICTSGETDNFIDDPFSEQ